MTQAHISGWTLYKVTFKESARSRRIRTAQQFSPSAETISEQFASIWESNEGTRPVVLSVRGVKEERG